METHLMWVTSPQHRYFVDVKVLRKFLSVFLICYVALSTFGMFVVNVNAMVEFHAPPTVSALAITSPKNIVPQSNSVAAPVTNYDSLDQTVKAWVAAQKTGTYSVVIQDLNDKSNRIAINEDKTYYMASIYKLFMTIRLSQTVDFNKWSTQKLVGRTNIADCLKAMISRSDNTCGEAMGNYLGWQKAENSAHVAGFTETRMGSDLIGSAHDTALYLQQLQAGKLFNQQITDLVLSSMSQQKYRSGIPSGCPSCTVLNKTGNYGAYNHDAAIVTNGNHKYIFVVFSQGASYAKIAELSQLVNSELAKP